MGRSTPVSLGTNISTWGSDFFFSVMKFGLPFVMKSVGHKTSNMSDKFVHVCSDIIMYLLMFEKTGITYNL